MVKHVILWQLKDELTKEQISEVKAGIKSGLEGLKGEIPGLIDIKVVVGVQRRLNADALQSQKPIVHRKRNGSA